MPRITREVMYMKMAHVLAERSTCWRANVGCIIVHRGRDPISWGYNGAPAGQPHCYGDACPRGKDGACTKSLHAEYNAVTRMTSRQRLLPVEVYCTHSPCPSCVDYMGNNLKKLDKLYFGTPYRITDPLKDLIERGIRVYQITPAGYIIDKTSDQIISGPEVHSVPSSPDS